MEMDNLQINDMIKDYLRYNSFDNSYECFDAEIRTKIVSKKLTQKPNESKPLEKPRDPPRIYTMIKGETARTKRENNLEKDIEFLSKKFMQVVQAGREITAIAVKCLQMLGHFTDKEPSLADTIEMMKTQLAKYHRIVINEGKAEGKDLIKEETIKAHQNELEKNVKEKYADGVSEALTSIRVDALRIAPELKLSFVNEIVSHDILEIRKTDGFSFVDAIFELANTSPSVKQSLVALLSVLATVPNGVDYITNKGSTDIIDKVITIVKEQDPGTVIQRFSIAVLQKISLMNNISAYLVKHELITWAIQLLEKSQKQQVHQFCVDYSAALLANMIQTTSTLKYLEENEESTHQTLESLLVFLTQQFSLAALNSITSALWAISKGNLDKLIEKTRFDDRIHAFLEKFSAYDTTDDPAAEEEKKIILDTCYQIYKRHEEHKQPLQDNQNAIEYPPEIVFEFFNDEVR